MKQFFSYFGVGGAAAIVEWACFFLFDSVGASYLISSIIAFVLATFANWVLGRMFTFKKSPSFRNNKGKEIVLIFLVSGIGLVFNLLLMYLFVDIVGMNRDIWKTIAKILSTGIVFIWNYLSRKLWIYR